MKIAICTTEAALTERGDSKGFQLQETPSFNSKSGQRRRLKRRNTPQYRLIRVYSKSSKQYWRERNRRKQVLKLTKDGYTLQQIAKQLGVSYRTVRRDAVKLRPYIKGQFNRHLAELSRQERERLDRELEDLSMQDMGKRFQTITNLMFKTRKLSKQEIEKQHNNMIFLDYDNLDVCGYPTIKIANPGGTFKTPYNLSVIAVKDGKPQHVLGGLKIG